MGFALFGWRCNMSVLPRLAAVMTGLVMAASTVVFASPASATFSPSPVGPAWEPDGPVHAVVAAGNLVIVGGSFTGGVAALDAGTGALQWTSTADGDVRALAMSADGSHVVAGGAFTTVSGVTHRRLAALSVLSGVADATWKPAVGGTVRDIVVADGIAYFGGSFRGHNGIAQKGLGAVTFTQGTKAQAVGSFNATTDGTVFALARADGRLMVGGRFTQVNGKPRSQLAAINLTSHGLGPWTPPAACLKCTLYWDLVTDGPTVYGASRNAGAVTRIDVGSAKHSWRTSANGDAQALTLIDGTLYAGGHFTTIMGEERTILAALNSSTGAVEPGFVPRFVGTWPGIWALDSTSSRLYAGGHFTHFGPVVQDKRPYLAMFGE
jgi:outer membrane protein assembly factor BamB